MSGSSKNLEQVELAKQTLKIFMDRGEDMSDVRHVIHYAYGGNFRGFGDALRELGYAVRSTANDDGVVAERHEAIGEEWRTATLVSLCELADIYGVEYDGWEASMTRQSEPEAGTKPHPEAPSFLSKIFGKKK